MVFTLNKSQINNSGFKSNYLDTVLPYIHGITWK